MNRDLPDFGKLRFKLGSVHPEPCPYCGGRLVLIFESRFWKLMYACRNEEGTFCKGSVGAHQDSGEPLGRPALEEVKQKRMDIHNNYFDILYRDKFWFKARKHAYRAMAAYFGQLEIPHIGNMMEDWEFEKVKLFSLQVRANEIDTERLLYDWRQRERDSRQDQAQ